LNFFARSAAKKRASKLFSEPLSLAKAEQRTLLSPITRQLRRKTHQLHRVELQRLAINSRA
jgi:hypothetical protein